MFREPRPGTVNGANRRPSTCVTRWPAGRPAAGRRPCGLTTRGAKRHTETPGFRPGGPTETADDMRVSLSLSANSSRDYVS